MEGKNKLSVGEKVNVNKRKNDLDKHNAENKERTKKRKETAKDRLLLLNSKYANGNFGIWIQCTKCDKWRKAMEYEEEHEVPEDWCCSMSLSGIRSCDEPENIENVNFSPVKFIPGTIVWAKYNGYPWWPGMIEDDPDTEEYYWKEKNGKWLYNVTFLDDKVTRAWVSASCVRSFADKPKNKYLSASYAKYSSLLAAAEMKARNAMNMSIQERLKKFSFAQQYKGKWGSPLASCDEGPGEEEGNGKDITQTLLEEVIDLESFESPDSTNSDNQQSGTCFTSINCVEQKQNEINHESQQQTSSKSDSEFVKNGKIEPHSRVNNQNNVAHLKIKNDQLNKTEENIKSHVISKGKKVKSTHKKLMKENTSISKNDISVLDKTDENGKNDTKNNSNKSNKKLNKQTQNKKDNKEETKLTIMKCTSKSVKTFNEKEKKEKNNKKESFNHSSNSKFKPPIKNNVVNECEDKQGGTSTNSEKADTKFKPPIKNNEINACQDKQNGTSMKSVGDDENEKVDANITLHKVESFANEVNLVKKEMSERNVEENKKWNKSDVKSKKTSKHLKKSENKCIEENRESENELKENIVKMLEKNLKSSLESMPKKENKKKENKKKHLKEDLANSDILDAKNYTKSNKSAATNTHQKKNAENVTKMDLSTEDAAIEKPKLTNTIKISTRQNINKKESKGVKNLKSEKFKKETEAMIQDNGFEDASDDEVKKDIPCNDFTEEKFSLSVEMDLQETEDYDSDPFEAD